MSWLGTEADGSQVLESDRLDSSPGTVPSGAWPWSHLSTSLIFPYQSCVCGIGFVELNEDQPNEKCKLFIQSLLYPGSVLARSFVLWQRFKGRQKIGKRGRFQVSHHYWRLLAWGRCRHHVDHGLLATAASLMLVKVWTLGSYSRPTESETSVILTHSEVPGPQLQCSEWLLGSQTSPHLGMSIPKSVFLKCSWWNLCLGRGMKTGEGRETGSKVLVKNQIFILSYRPVPGVRDLGVWSAQDQTGCRSSVLTACAQQGFRSPWAGRQGSITVSTDCSSGGYFWVRDHSGGLLWSVSSLGITQRELWFLCIPPPGISVKKVITFEGFVLL